MANEPAPAGLQATTDALLAQTRDAIARTELVRQGIQHVVTAALLLAVAEARTLTASNKPDGGGDA